MQLLLNWLPTETKEPNPYLEEGRIDSCLSQWYMSENEWNDLSLNLNGNPTSPGGIC